MGAPLASRAEMLAPVGLVASDWRPGAGLPDTLRRFAGAGIALMALPARQQGAELRRQTFAAACALWHAAPAFLPSASATLRPAHLADWLAQPDPDLVQCLDRLAGRGQIVVTAAAEQATPARTDGTGLAYLRNRHAAARALQATADDLAARICALLDRVTVAPCLAPPRVQTSRRAQGIVVTVDRALLVETAAAPALLDRLRAEAGTNLRVSGPWPPYSFAAGPHAP